MRTIARSVAAGTPCGGAALWAGKRAISFRVPEKKWQKKSAIKRGHAVVSPLNDLPCLGEVRGADVRRSALQLHSLAEAGTAAGPRRCARRWFYFRLLPSAHTRLVLLRRQSTDLRGFQRGERAEHRRWRMQRGERVAAVEKIEVQRKPDDFFGHRKRYAGPFRSPEKGNFQGGKPFRERFSLLNASFPTVFLRVQKSGAPGGMPARMKTG